MTWSAPMRAANAGRAASGTRPPAVGSPRMSQVGTPVRCRIGEVGKAAVPVAVVEEDGAGGLDLELDQRFGLGPDVLVGPGRVEPSDLADRRLEVRV